jgi:hypothetical protein
MKFCKLLRGHVSHLRTEIKKSRNWETWTKTTTTFFQFLDWAISCGLHLSFFYSPF